MQQPLRRSKSFITLLWWKKTSNMNVKTTFMKTVIGDVLAHLKPQKFTIWQTYNVLYHHYMLCRMLRAVQWWNSTLQIWEKNGTECERKSGSKPQQYTTVNSKSPQGRLHRTERSCHLSAQHLRCVIIKNWGTHPVILGERTMASGGIDGPESPDWMRHCRPPSRRRRVHKP